jgi:TP901 family phage tail tape measure protein
VNAFSIFGRMSLDDSEYQRGLKSAEGETTRSVNRMTQDWKKVGEAAQTVGKTLSVALTAPIVAFGALAIRSAADFESSMNKVRGITQATGNDFQRLEQLAKDLGASTQFSASQAADAMGFLAMAGFEVEDIMSALPGVLELAAAGGLDLARAADIASNVLSGFGLEASEVARINDVLALASISANTNVEQLGNAFKFVAPVAAALGVSVEESAAAIGIMSDAGIQGEMAGTALRNILGELAKESDTLGISVFDANEQLLPLADIIEQLEVRGLNTAEAMGEFGQRAGPALQALLSRGSGALRDLTTNLEDAGGTAARLATTNMEGFNGAVLNLRSAIEGLQIAIAQSGLLAFFQGLVESFTGLVRFLTTLNPQFLQLVTIISAFAAALGPALFIFGRLLIEIPKMTAALAVLRGALASLFVGPQAVIALAILAVAALFVAYQRNFGGIQEKTEEVLGRVRAAFNDLNRAFGTAVESIQKAWTRLTTDLGDEWQVVTEYLSSAFAFSVNQIANVVVFLLQNLARIITFGNVLVSNWRDVQFAWYLIMQAIRDIAGLAGDVIRLRFELVGIAVQATFSAMADAVRLVFFSMINGIIDLTQNSILRLNPFLRGFGLLLDEVVGDTTSSWEEIGANMMAPIDAANAEITSTLGKIEDRFDGTVRVIGSMLRDLRAQLVAAGQDTEDLDEVIATLDETSVATGAAFQALGGSIAGAGTASGDATESLSLLSIAGIDAAIAAAELGFALAETYEARLDFTQQIDQLNRLRDAIMEAVALRDITADATGGIIPFSLLDPGVTVEIITKAEALSNFAKRLLDTRTAANEASAAYAANRAEMLAMDEVGVAASATTMTQAELLRALVAEYWRGVEAANAAAAATRAAAAEAASFAALGLGASTSAQDFANHAQSAADAANAMEVGLAGANAEIALTPVEALAAADALVAFLQVQQRLGKATEDDVNRALVQQAEALKSLMASLSPTSAAWRDAANRLADIHDGLRINETALLDQMSRVHENTEEWHELEMQLERIRSIMEALGLGTGGPGVPQEVDSIIQTGITALRSYLDAAGGNIATFGNAALDIATKFPLVSSALEGFSIEVTDAGKVIVQGFDPMTALTAMFMELLSKSESFGKLIQMVNERLAPLAERIIEPLVRVLGTLLEAVFPVIEVLVNLIELGMKPFLFIFTNVLAPLLTGLANTIRNVWNAFARVIPGMKRIKEPSKTEKQTGPRVISVAPNDTRFAGLTIRQDSIAGQEAMLQAAREFERTTQSQTERDLIRLEIERIQATINRMRGIEAPAPPVDKPAQAPPSGSIEALRAEAAALNAERGRTTDPARLAEINNRLFDINLEVRRLEAIGVPVTEPIERPTDRPGATPTPTAPKPPAGTIAALEEERRALQAQLRVAAESEIPELNTRIAALSEEITRLQRLGLGQNAVEEFESVLERATFGATPQAIQLAVATPLVEASHRMLDAADVMNRVFGSMMPGSETGFGALPPFTSAIERMTPVLERLLEEGVSVMMGQRSDSGPLGSPTAFLRGV